MFCADCGAPISKGATYCQRCKAKGSRNPRFGQPLSPETREKMRQAALNRERKPYKKRSTKPSAGHDFARRWFQLPELCDRCKTVPPVDRHHKDGNPLNNDRSNIAFLCRRCHQMEDGRHKRLKQEIPSMGGKAAQAKKRRL